MELFRAQKQVGLWLTDKFEEPPDALVQFVKLAEELGELADGLLKDDLKEIKDGLADCLFVLLGIAELKGVDLESGFIAVLDSNITKARAKKGQRNPAKGEGFQEPRL